MSDETVCPIIGIGASAGGLEAVNDMLGAVIEPCGMAFVLVQHLDPNHESMMAELIGRRTALTVTQISGGELVEAEHVYVIPPGARLYIDNGRLNLSPFSEPRGLRRPIDEFFISLGKDQEANCACVVLSGTGADGSTGLRAVKELGGIVVAQQPNTAGYDGMPVAAISTGLVDFVLPPTAICGKVKGYFERRLSNTNSGVSHVSVTEHLEDICSTLREATGHDFSGYKTPTMVRRIERRMQVLAIPNPGEYLRRISTDERECAALFQDLLINVTSFFRDPGMFDTLLKQVILPIVEAHSGQVPIRIWVPGCSSGEEAYTLAILFASAAEKLNKHPQIQIFATDIDPQMLEIAREARYPLTSLKDIPEELREKYLIGLEGRFQVTPRLRDMVQFSAHSVIKDPPFSRLDLVSCRNMLIYMNDTIQNQFIPLMYYALKSDGVLFLGPSEGIGHNDKLFEPIDQKSRIYRRRPGEASYPVNFPAIRNQRHVVPVTPLARQTDAVKSGARSTLAAERILERYAHATIVTDEQGNILTSNGKLAKFLDFPTGSAVMHAVALARPGLAEAFGPLFRKAIELKRRVAARNVTVVSEMGSQTIDLAVDPLPDGTYLTVFVEVGTFQIEVAGDFLEEGVSDDRFHDLEEELRETRFRLRSTVEELETANEELKSSNEEMMSMNEELQSANEELSTLNDEMKHKIDQLSQANTDMSNFVESTDIALVVIDAEAKVKSFTHPIVDVFPLKDGDYGRSLDEVASLIADDRAISDALSVTSGAEPVERVVHSKDGLKTFAMRILPYRAGDDVLGATLTFNDVTRLVKAEDDLRHETEKLQLALEAGEMGVWQFDVDTNITEIDDMMRRVWELESHEVLTVENFMKMIDEDDRDDVENALQKTINEGTAFKAKFRVNNSLGTRWLQGAGRLSKDPKGTGRVTGVNFDITAERTAIEGREFLLREINHRVKNLFAIVPAMLSLSAKEADTIPELVADVRARIAALGRSHELTRGQWEAEGDYQTGPTGAELHSLVDTVLEPYRANDSVLLEGNALTVPHDAITPMGLILHEWATNSVKYGALSNESGVVTVSWKQDREMATLVWSESGGPVTIESAAKDGFGSKLVSYSVRQMGGKLDTDWNPKGIRMILQFSVPAGSAA